MVLYLKDVHINTFFTAQFYGLYKLHLYNYFINVIKMSNEFLMDCERS